MVLDRQFPPDHRVEKEAKSLIANGHEIHLFSFNHDNLKKDEEIEGVYVHRFYMPKKVFKKLSAMINVLPFYNWFWKWHLTKMIRQLDIQALHVHDLPLSKISLNLKRRFGIPVIIDMHENYADWIEETPHYNTLVGRVVKNLSNWKEYEKHSLQSADYVIGVAPVLIRKMIEEYDLNPDKIIFVPNTPDPDFLQVDSIDEDICKQLDGKFNIIFVGGIAYLRGLQNVIPRMVEIKKRIPEAQLVIVGDGTYLPELKKIVARFGLEDSVIFPGWQSITRVAGYIKLSQIGLYPPMKYKGVDDKVPTKMFQYWALGKPIISADHQLPREMIQKYQAGFTVDFENNGEKFVEYVEQLYKNPQLRERMGENGRRAIEEEWNWDTTVQPLVELYAQLDSRLKTNG